MRLRSILTAGLLISALAGCIAERDTGYGAAATTAPAKMQEMLPGLFTATPCRVDRLVATPNPSGSLPRLTNPELQAAGQCLLPYQKQVFAGLTLPVAAGWADWRPMTTQPYRSEHGVYVFVYADRTAAPAYGAYEKSGTVPTGGRIAKSSFTVSGDGKLSVGPLFFMEKKPPGLWTPDGNWQFTLVQGDGGQIRQSRGDGGEQILYCAQCHATNAAKSDYLMLVPEPYQVKG